MGYGDDIMASGMARGAAARGKRIAFGDGRKIIWGPWSDEIFRHNPNVATPGSERLPNLEWIDYYKGHRKYNTHTSDRWLWNYDFRPTPGEIYFDLHETNFFNSLVADYILIEPNVPWHKSVAPNKDWSLKKYQAVTDELLRQGERVAQISYGRDRLKGVEVIKVDTFRKALAALSQAKFAVLPEGGMHHGAAALGVPAVVIFGGFIPPKVTGYDFHYNLTGGAEACGSLQACDHCRQALDKITVGEVIQLADMLIRDRADVKEWFQDEV